MELEPPGRGRGGCRGQRDPRHTVHAQTGVPQQIWVQCVSTADWKANGTHRAVNSGPVGIADPLYVYCLTHGRDG